MGTPQISKASFRTVMLFLLLTLAIAPAVNVSAFGDGGGGVISIGKQSPEPCKDGQQTYYVNSTRYCVPCTGKLEVIKNNPYDITCVQIKQQKAVVASGTQPSQMTNQQKAFAAVMVASFILLFTNKIVKWK